MKQYLKVKGTQEKVANLEVNVDTVYVRSNIERIENDDFTGWQYDEIQYSLREYQTLIGKNTNMLKTDVEAMAEVVVISVSDLQALADTLIFALEEIKNLKGGN